MSEKQLNFLNIFETSQKEKASVSENEPYTNFDENDYEDPVDFDLEEQRLRAEADLIFQKERERDELELKRRQRLLDSRSFCKPSDFQSVLPEIQQYAERARLYRALYEQASPERKSELYPRLVWPETYDEPEYLEGARLYINYLEAVKREKGEQQFKKSPKNSFSKKKKEPVISAKKQEKIVASESLVEVDVQVDDSPNPYGDIYPYSRNWRP